MPPFLRHLLFLLLLLAFAAFVWLDNANNRGITFSPAPEPIPGGSGPVVGVNFFNIHMEPDPATVRQSFALAAAMGARYARMQVPWDDLEIHGRGDFEDRRNLEAVGAISAWAKYDRLATLANEFDIELIWRLERPPLWAREQFAAMPVFQAGLEQDGHSTGPPDDFNDYANFVRAVVERYNGDGIDDAPGSPVVRHFQIWNEPNLKNEWNWQSPRPEDFVELLRVGAMAARAANPEAVIIFPGLAPTDGLDVRAPMTELEYLDRVYRAGGAAYFDVMAAQAYGLGQSPAEHRYVFLRNRNNWSWRRAIDTRNDVSRVVLLREVMERHSDSATPIWVTEFGWNSAPDHLPPERRMTWGAPVDEATKAAYLLDQLERARDEWPWMGVMNIWMLRYGGYAAPHPDDPTPYFALVSRDWQLTPAYDALQAHAAAPAIAGVGSHHWASHPAVEALAPPASAPPASSPLTLPPASSPLTSPPASSPLASASAHLASPPASPGGWRVRFSGTRLVLLGGLDPETAPVQATLNGQPDGLERVLFGRQRAFATPRLPDGVHTLELSGTPPPQIFRVERDRPWGWFWDYGPLLLLVALAFSGGASMLSLGPPLTRSFAWLRHQQARLRGQRSLAARLIQPEGLITLGLLAGLIIAYRGSTLLPITLVGLGIFALCALVRPDLALLAVPLTLPFYFIPKGIFDTRFAIRDSGITLPLHEILLVVVCGAVVVRVGWEAKKRRSEEAGRRGNEEAGRQGGEEAKKRGGEEAKKRRSEEAEKRGGEEARKRRSEEAGRRRSEEAEKRRSEEAGRRRSGEAGRRRSGEAGMQGGEEAEQAQQKVPGHRASHSSGGADFSRRSDLPTEVGTTTLKLKASFWNFPLLSHSSWFLPTLLFLAAALWGVWIAGERGPALRELRWMVIEPLLIIGLAGIMARWHAAHVIADGRTGDLPRPASRVSPPASRLPHPPPYWHRLLQAWLLGGCIAALVALLQLVGLNLVPLFGIKAGFSADSFFVEGVQRVSGLYGHPNNLGLAMGRYWPLAAALAYAAWQQAGMRHAWPYFVATGLCMAALLASFSRGAYLGALVAAFVLAAMLLPTTRWRDRRLWWAGGATLGAGLLIISLSVILGIERLNPFGASGGIRMQTWASALAMLRDHPLGVGLDQFGRLYPSYIAPELRATNEINTAHPHNLLLDIALRMGPLGLIAFAWLLANFYRRSVPQNAILVGAAAAMSASLAHGLVDQFYFWPDLALSFWLLVALVVGRTDLSPTDY